MNLGQATLKSVNQEKTPIVILDTNGNPLRAFGDDVQQYEGPARARNAAGIPFATLRWLAKDEDGVENRLMDAFEAYLTPIIADNDFWSIEWRGLPTIERDHGQAQIRCRLIVHRRSNRPDAGIMDVVEGTPSWALPT
jgi:hypothetical protein